jgi:ABC-type anion transport system duplicated permease subunit
MTEARAAIIAGCALTVMGGLDFLRNRTSDGTIAIAMLGVEIVAIVVGLIALLAWARLREKQKKQWWRR